MLTQDIRRRFLEYFKKMGHEVISSAPVVPHSDPTLLFTNAGMNQFKDVFLAKSARDYTKAVTCQKCIRVGGKHNDLENVGHTKRHLTFFEMLGNFSFGDYFKDQAIEMAWHVSTEIFGFEKEKIYPTIFQDDEESFTLWQKYVPANRITRFGEKDNFWTMGDTGPCGPCSELYYDKGSNFGNATNPLEDSQGERFLEFWNLVFMQFNRTPGKQEPLPKPSIDTGAGLERVMSLIQKKESVYQTDILRALIATIEEKAKVSYDYHDTKLAPAFHVIADHLRCLSFAIADGVQPSNVDRGYVLRKVLRRAVRYGKILGFEAPFLASLLPTLTKTMGSDYKELMTAESLIAEILTLEEESFFRTLKRGGNILNQIIETSAIHSKMITGADAFKLKDTYGLPFEEILLIAKDSDLHVDSEGFQKLEIEAKEKSKIAKKATSQVVEESLYKKIQETQGDCIFVRKEREDHTSTICCLIKDGASVDTLEAGSSGILIMKETPFYAEMGGQVGDTGAFANEAGKFTVTNCISPYKGVICHIGSVDEGQLRVGDSITAKVDWKRREKIENNHTATHLLHFALHEVLGTHTRQAGSVVDADRLRFDFSHHKSVSAEELRAIEQLINEKIRLNTKATIYEIPYEEAQKKEDIKQFFGEKYGKVVRVVDINYSKELCGGTHTSRTGNIGYFRIIKEGSIAAGVRRIEAVTGSDAEAFAYTHEAELNAIAELLKTPQQKVCERIEKLHDELKASQYEIKMLKKAHIDQLLTKLLPLQISTKGFAFIAADVPVSVDELKILTDEISLKNPSSVIALGCKSAGKGHLLVKVSADIIKQGISASDLLKKSLSMMDGNGGGKADMAQGAGKSPDKLELALQVIKDLL